MVVVYGYDFGVKELNPPVEIVHWPPPCTYMLNEEERVKVLPLI